MTRRAARCAGRVLGAALLLGAANAHATIVFSGTGLDFLEDPLASFPTLAPAASGTSIDFSPDTENQILAAYPLADAGSFAGITEPVQVLIRANLTRLSEDFDPVFVVTDGTGAIGGQVGDNPAGSARAIEATVAGDAVVIVDDGFIFDNAGFVEIGGSLDVLIRVVIAESTEVSVSFLAGDASTQAMTSLDRNAALDFLLVANSFLDAEQYRVNALTLEILPSVPEPGSGVLLLSLMGAWLGARRLTIAVTR